MPDQYPLLVDLKCVNSLLELLSHDNTDISTKVVHLLQVCKILCISQIGGKKKYFVFTKDFLLSLIQFQEFTDVDILHESEEGAEDLINALAEAEAPALLLHNLARLDEQVPDERDAVHNTLGICFIH